MPKRLSRFSLLSFLLLAGLICVAVSHIRVTQENRRQRAEIGKLKEDLGYIIVHDPEKAYLRQLETVEVLTWRYRIYLPPKKKYMLYVRAGPGTSGTGFRQSDDQFTMTVAIRKNSAGRWVFTAVFPRGAHSSTMSDEIGNKFADPDHDHPRLRHKQQELPADGEIELFRLGDDIRFWLEPQQPSGGTLP